MTKVKSHRILLVDDEDHIRKILSLNLNLEGYEVVTASTGKKALEIIENQYFDLLLLDIMLPEISGSQICEQVRLKNHSVGIILISAKGSTQDRIEGLKIGADDYMPKPFHLEELLLRIKNVLKRRIETKKENIHSYSFGYNSINFITFEAIAGDKKIHLTQKEVLLLKLLIEKNNEVVSRKQILQNVWGYDVYPSTRTVDNFIMSFRKYFEDNPRNPKYFHSVRGVGYKFTS